MQESLKQVFLNLNLESFIPYVENTTYLVLFFIFLTIVLFYLISYLAKFLYKNKEKSVERKKPSLNEIIDKDDVKVSDDNDFVDVLVAIEEEMAAVRELYVGGYISKGVYISETDRLYEKAKIFGL
jgi:hypothetical protein|tara:strand:+ start:32 stop:409 length:378 start_codon:yes stop_codon:yes gene_type:complete